MRFRFAPLLLILLAGCGPKPPDPTPAPAEPTLSDADARTLAKERLKQICIALHEHQSEQGLFPAGIVGAGGVGLSWRVQILPHVGQEELYKQFKLDEPWDGPTNKPLIEKMPAVYAAPGKPSALGKTYVQALCGPAAFIKSPPVTAGQKPGWNAVGRRIHDFLDGTSNTLAVVEAAEPVVWTKPDDLSFDGKKLPKLGGVFEGGFHGVLAHGEVYFFLKDVTTDDLLRKLITINDGQALDLNPIRKANGEKEVKYGNWSPPPPPPVAKPPAAKPPG